MLDLVYIINTATYRAVCHPHLDYTNLCYANPSIQTACQTCLACSEPDKKNGPQESFLCFKTLLNNLEEYTASVAGYISMCIDDVTVSNITPCPNQKLGITAEVSVHH